MSDYPEWAGEAVAGISELPGIPRIPGLTTTVPIDQKLPSDATRLKKLFSRLKWLGLPDWRGSATVSRDLLDAVLPHCIALRTLSIRGRYSAEMLSSANDSHASICRLISGITTHASPTVETLELRLSFPYLDRLVEHLRAHNSNIKRVGIDLGAWVQIYPLRTANDELTDEEVRNAAVAAAYQTRRQAYQEEHNKVAPEGSKWWLPEVKARLLDQGSEAIERQNGVDGPTLALPEQDAKHAYERNFYRDDGGSYLQDTKPTCSSTPKLCPLQKSGHSAELDEYVEEVKVNTLPGMLCRLHDMGTGLQKDGLELFAL